MTTATKQQLINTLITDFRASVGEECANYIDWEGTRSNFEAWDVEELKGMIELTPEVL